MVLSYDPETIVFVSELIATVLTQAECPSSLTFSAPVLTSHNLVMSDEDTNHGTMTFNVKTYNGLCDTVLKPTLYKIGGPLQ